MLEKIDLTKKMGKKEYKEAMEGLTAELSELQRECKNEKIPVMIVFEGLGAAGKGTLINQLIQSLDPRGFHAVSYTHLDVYKRQVQSDRLERSIQKSR